MRKLVLVLIVLAAGQLGCSGGADDTPSRGDNSPDSENEDRSNNPGSNELLLTFRRSGGFAGTTETITIRSDGRAELEGDAAAPQRLEVSPALLDRLEEELEDLDWERAATEPQNVVCADCFTYDVRAGGQRITTTALGQSGKELSDLLSLIDEIFATGSRS